MSKKKLISKLSDDYVPYYSQEMTSEEFNRIKQYIKDKTHEYITNKYKDFVFMYDPDYGRYPQLEVDNIPVLEIMSRYEGSPFPYYNQPLSFSVDRNKEWFDNWFNEYYDKGYIKLKDTPEVTSYGTPHINLYTYPFFSSIPVSHSELEGPDGFFVNRQIDSANYNFFTNNCSDATYQALKDIFGNKFERGNIWRPVVTPYIVEYLAKKIPGAKYYENSTYGVPRVSIPLTGIDVERFNEINQQSGGGALYESLEDANRGISQYK